jgi:hypothetical protein
MRNALSYKRLVRIHRRFLIRVSKLVGGKERLIGLSKLVAMVTAGCSLILLLAQGCATTSPPAPLGQDVRASLGTIGVISVGPELMADVAGPIGTGREAGRGALKGGAIGGLSGAGVGALAGLSTGPCAPVLVPVLAGIGAAGGLVIGAGTGAIVRGVRAVPTETAESLEAVLHDGLASRDLPADLRQRVLKRASMTPRHAVDLGALNRDPSTPHDYTAFAADGVHSVLEITVTEIVFDGEGGRDPTFALQMKAQIRLIRIADNQVLWTNDDIRFRGEDVHVSSWTNPDLDYLTAEFEVILERLAQQIGDAVFMETGI